LTDGYRWGANLATLGNALMGVGAIAYVFAGNSVFAMLLIVGGIALDGLDGLFSRRSAQVPRFFGRVADSVADAITFGVAPAVLIIVHSTNPLLWDPYQSLAYAVGFVLIGLTVARLTYFTVRGYQRSYFLGAPTPQTALAVVVLVLLFQQPAFVGTNPAFLLAATAGAAICMVLPIPYPKVRRGSPIRPVSAMTAAALVFALLPLQFFPPPDSTAYLFAFVCAAAGAAGVLAYYCWGPFTVDLEPVPPEAAHA
jgi:CDP-diacylglycerol--serine O-phosphatidyltransferase